MKSIAYLDRCAVFYYESPATHVFMKFLEAKSFFFSGLEGCYFDGVSLTGRPRAECLPRL